MALDGDPGSNFTADGQPRPNLPTRRSDGSIATIKQLPPGTIQINGQAYAPVIPPNSQPPQSIADIAVRTDQPIGPLARIVRGIRYMISGAGPGSWMSPNQPLVPLQQQTEGRQFDYQVGRNLQQTPSGEGAAADQWQLRALADNHDVTRLAIETRKDQMVKLKFKISHADEDKDSSDDPEVLAIEEKLRYPDNRKPWQQWLRELIEEVLVTDAATIYPRMTFAGDLWGLDLLDGASVKPLIDATGRRPIPPEPAYQQWLKGIPASDYTSDELIYAPRNTRVWKVLGFSPVAQIMMTVNIALRRQISQLEFFTSGSVPEVLLGTPASWTPKQILETQTIWDSMIEGVQAFKRKAKFIPGDIKPTMLKENPVKDEFDEWLARVVCFCFSLPPTAFVRQNNRATAESAQDVALQEGLAPLMAWVKDLMDMILAKYFNRPDLRFSWADNKSVAIDLQAKVDDTNLKNGSTTLNEVRNSRGMDPYPAGIGDRALIYTSTGIIPLDTAIDNADNPPEPPPALQQIGPDGKPMLSDPNAPPEPGGKRGKTPPGPEATAAPKPGPGADGKKSAAKLLKRVTAKRKGLKVKNVGPLKRKLTQTLAALGKDIAKQITDSLDLGKSVADAMTPELFALCGQHLDPLFKAAGDDKPAIAIKAPKFVSGVDIPYVAGISKDGGTIYFDRRLPKRMQVSGVRFDPREFVAVHELVEYYLIQTGKGYDDGPDSAHYLATHAEHAAVAARGIDTAKYEESFQPIDEACLATAKAGEMTDIPENLARYPYSGDAAKLLDKPVAKAAADGSKVLKPTPAVNEAIANLNFQVLTDTAFDDLSYALKDAADDGGMQALTQIGIEDEDITKLANERAEKWADERAGELIKSDASGGELVDATRDMIRGTVTKAEAEGWSGAELSKQLQGDYAFSPERASLIARTELKNADSAGAMEGYRASGVVAKKAWQASNEDNVCDECQENVDAGEIDLDDDFPSGDDCPTAHPGCACVCVPIVSEDDES